MQMQEGLDERALKMQFSIYRKADNQLNAICRLQTYIDQKEKATINTFLN